MKYLRGHEMYQALLKLPVSVRGHILGFDVGAKYVGVAVSDKLHRVALPVRVLYREQLGVVGVVEEVHKMVGKYSISACVAGWPRHHQRPTPAAMHVDSFIDELSKSGKFDHLYYTKWDESYTSKLVDRMTKPLNLKYIEKKEASDMYAAVAILQDYLDEMYFDELKKKQTNVQKNEP